MRPLVAATIVAAAGGPGPVQDPAIVIGVQLGQPLAVQTVRTCERGARSARPEGACLERPVPMRVDEDHVSIWSPPALPFDYSADLLTFRGMVASLTMTMPARQFERAVATVQQRFGEPAATETFQMTTIGGAVLQTRVLTWSVGAVQIRAQERAAVVDEAVLVFEHAATAAAARAARAADADRKAGRL